MPIDFPVHKFAEPDHESCGGGAIRGNIRGVGHGKRPERLLVCYGAPDRPGKCVRHLDHKSHQELMFLYVMERIKKGKLYGE